MRKQWLATSQGLEQVDAFADSPKEVGAGCANGQDGQPGNSEGLLLLESAFYVHPISEKIRPMVLGQPTLLAI
jgi:hypothetical protein